MNAYRGTINSAALRERIPDSRIAYEKNCELDREIERIFFLF